MKAILTRAARGFLIALAAFLYLNGCAPKAALVKDPGLLAGRTDIKVSPEERQLFLSELKEGAKGPRAARALYFLGMAEFQESRYPEAGKYFQRLGAEHPNSGWDHPAVYMMGATLERMGDAPRAFVQYQRLIEPRSLSGTAMAYESELSVKSRKACRRLVEEPMAPEQLQQLIDFPALAEFQPALRLARLKGIAAAASGLSPTAKIDDLFLAVEEFIRLYPDSAERPEVEKLAKDADRAVPVDKRALGLMLPLSGRQAALGAQLKQGVELAIDELNAQLGAADAIRLLVEDEGDNSVTAVAAAQKLMLQSNVIGVLGPMSSDASLAVLPLAGARRTPLLSPYAMRPDLASASPYFFRNSMTPEKQAMAMANHALFELKVTRVAALYPDTAYGQALAGAFSARMAELGAPVLMSLTYSAGNSDFKDIFVRLGGVNPTVMKDAGYQEKREQDARIESASTVLGKAVLALKAHLEAKSATAEAFGDTSGAYRPLSFPARVAVFDFSSVTSAAVYNAGRSFSDRFARVLGQLEELAVLGPEEGLKRLKERGLSPENLSPALAVELGRVMNADFVLLGDVIELTPDWNYLNEAARESGKEGRQARSDIELFSKSQVFKVSVALLDARSSSVVASARFEAGKMKPPLPNSLGLQALYLPGKAGEAVQAASAMSFCDLRLVLLGSDLWKSPELLQNDNAAALEGARLSSGFFSESGAANVKRFVEAYRRRYAAVPSQLSAQAYDAALIMGTALKNGAATREELRQALFNLKNFDGVSGLTSFDGRQDAVKRLPILKVNSVAKTFEQVNP